MKIALLGNGTTAAGGAPYVSHNERLADPLDSFTQELSRFTSKKAKTLADHQELARLEFFGGMHTDPPMDYPLPSNAVLAQTRPIIPAWTVVRCLQEGAKRHKRGLDVLRGVTPYVTVADLIYDGPTNPVEMYEEGTFSLRKTVGVNRKRVMRTRPQYTDWHLRLEAEMDEEIWNLEPLRECWKAAGWYCGIGEMRPIYGRFVGTIEVL